VVGWMLLGEGAGWLWLSEVVVGHKGAGHGGCEGVGVGIRVVVLSRYSNMKWKKLTLFLFSLSIWAQFLMPMGSVNPLGAAWVICLARECVCGVNLVNLRWGRDLLTW
jgi:hypothetical protein